MKYAATMLLGLVAVAGCSVDVPETYNGIFTCNDSSDCAPDYTCVQDGTFGTFGRCAKSDDPCASLTCNYGLVCSINQDHQGVCGECRDYGCGPGYVCVASGWTDVTSICVSACATAGTGCQDDVGNAGRCIAVSEPKDASYTIPACLACNWCSGNTVCTYRDPAASWTDGAWCAETSGTTCNYNVCGDGSPCLGGLCGNSTTCSTGCDTTERCWPDGLCRNAWCNSAADCPPSYDCSAGTCTSGGGTAWYELGGSASSGVPGSDGVQSLDVASEGSGNPVVVYVASVGGTPNDRVYVRRWNGSGWDQLFDSHNTDGSLNVATNAYNPSIAVDIYGNVFVAWQEDYASVYVKHWDPSYNAWYGIDDTTIYSTSGSGLAVAAYAPQYVGQPQIALDPGSNPLVAWSESDSNGVAQIFLRRWAGIWVDIDGSASAATGGISKVGVGDAAALPALAVSGDSVAVAWVDSTSTVAHVAESVASGAWNTLPALSYGSSISTTSFTYDNYPRPVVAVGYWNGSTERVHAARYDATAWTDLIDVTGQQPSIVRDSHGYLGLAWSAVDVSDAAFFGYDRSDSNGFVEIDGSQSTGVSLPVSGVSIQAWTPTVAAGPNDGNPICIAWMQGAARLRCHAQPPL